MRSHILLTAALGACVAACGATAKPGPAGVTPSAIAYEAKVRSADPWVIDVRATFEGGALRGAIAFPAAVRGVVVEEAGGERTPEQVGRAWKVDCRGTCTVRYTVDLSAAAQLTEDSPGVALRSGGDVLALGSTWLLRPEPAAPLTKATLRVDARDPASPAGEPFSFAAPFPKDATGAYALVARDIGALGYTAWGRFTAFEVQATKGTIDAVVLRGDRAISDAVLARWIHATALALDTVYGRFPIERTFLAVVPSPDSDEVDFGRTVPAGGASIVVYVGERAGTAELYDDWVLAHEMFHLGVPSMPREGTWIDEGLATYYGPVLRARAGLTSTTAVWAELTRILPMGVATAAQPALAKADDHDRVYFGGSLFSLTADVEIRKRTGGKRSLDDGLRQVLAEGGKATEVWSLEGFIAALDRGAGAPVVRPLLDRVRTASAPCGPAVCAGTLRDFGVCAPDDVVSLVRLFDALGVHAGTTEVVTFDDGAPLAGLRRSIVVQDPRVVAAVTEGTRTAAAPAAGSTRAKAGVEKP